MQSLGEYCRPFKDAYANWPPLPTPVDAREAWWQCWLKQSDRKRNWHELRLMLPQLLLSPGEGVCNGSAYARLVLRGEPPQSDDLELAPVLNDSAGLTIRLAPHPTGAVPVVCFSDHDDFVLAVRCLAHRCKAISVPSTVHAQAISGLIHWGLIRDINPSMRCQILLLHKAPYASLASETIPGASEPSDWLNASETWRLEHELTHIACQRLVGEMRINLFDELIADALGMIAALGQFDADLFRRGLGLSSEGQPSPDARAPVYVATLDPLRHTEAYQLVLQRANELAERLNRNQWPLEPLELLAKLVRCQLDQPLIDRDC